MAIKSTVLEYLDAHPEWLDPDESYMENARRLAEEGVIPSDKVKTAGRYVGQWADEHGAESEASQPPESMVEKPPDEPVGLDVLEHDADYSEEGDYYEAWIPYYGQPVEVSGETARKIKRWYSNEVGKGDTLSEIATRLAWPQPVVKQFKRAMDWVHDDTRYTDHEHLTRDTSDLVHSTVQAKKQEYIAERNKELWKEIKSKAKKFDRLKAGKLDPIAEHVVDNPPAGDVPAIDGEPRQYMAVFSPADLHFGKLGVDGYNIDAARDLVLDTTERILQRMTRHGRPERTVLVLGNDWWHVDNVDGATTSGTPQDLDGLPRDLVGLGYDLMVEVIDRIRQIGPVEVRVVTSNHGEWSDYHTMHGLRLGYRNVEAVDVVCETSPRQYLRYGKCLIGLEHGDGAKDSKLPTIMAKERPEDWGQTEWRFWLTGHMHHLAEKDRGVVIMQAPSLSGDDRWHEKQGYVLADRGNVAYLFDPELGHTDRMLAMVG